MSHSFNRRQLIAAGLATGAWAMLHREPLARTLDVGGRKLAKADVPTPALVLDLDRFEANLKTMMDHCRRVGCQLRPHAKTHKCPEIAKRQIAAGAIGISAATVPEAEAIAAAGIDGVLLTSPIVEPEKIERMVTLAKSGRKVMLSVGHAREVELLAAATASLGVELDLLIDIDVGDRRTGILPGAPAVELAQLIARHKQLHVRGVQAYAGHASHVVGFEARRKTADEARAKAVETQTLLNKAGFDARILSGASTGTYNIDGGKIDADRPTGMTELQCGSYVFMDVDYRRIGGRDGQATYVDFQPSLTLVATVVNATHADRITVDAGTKALDTTTTNLPEAVGRTGLTYARNGDEFGALTAAAGAALPKIGERVEFIVPHCDPTVHLHDRLYAVRGEYVEQIWPIAARREN